MAVAVELPRGDFPLPALCPFLVASPSSARVPPWPLSGRALPQPDLASPYSSLSPPSISLQSCAPPLCVEFPRRAPAHLPLAAGPCHARRAPSGLLCSPRFSLVPRRALPSVFNVERRHLSGVLRWPQIEALLCAQSSDPLRARSLHLPQPRSGRPSSTRRPLGSPPWCWSCPSAPVASSCYSMPRQSPCCSSAPSRAILCSVRAVFLEHAAPSPCSLFFSATWSLLAARISLLPTMFGLCRASCRVRPAPDPKLVASVRNRRHVRGFDMSPCSPSNLGSLLSL
ncbi:uncharacterized protein [Zea mays]|jgi:hypothetical protein|uniref:Uncharacterized protein n=1 Tax=Zea mays TaxID=4577 RepID=B4FVT0_MAIZE|nr:uncharacterized protein LOC118472249 [Zea mays]ACF86223.1 unknown [Zea mays]|eukprot:NP_001141387.1 uncharacterized protein LOC100273478 [Zea mays]